MAGVVAGSVAGWSPVGRRDDTGSGSFSQEDGRSQLEREGVELHPNTKEQDPVVVDQPGHVHAPPSQISEISPAPASSSHKRSTKD